MTQKDAGAMPTRPSCLAGASPKLTALALPGRRSTAAPALRELMSCLDFHGAPYQRRYSSRHRTRMCASFHAFPCGSRQGFAGLFDAA